MHGNATILKKLVAAERKENRVALSGAACRTLLKLRDNIYGVLCLVLPPKWGRTEVVIQASDITASDDIFYDDDFTFEFIPLLLDLQSYTVYDIGLDDILLDIMLYLDQQQIV